MSENIRDEIKSPVKLSVDLIQRFVEGHKIQVPRTEEEVFGNVVECKDGFLLHFELKDLDGLLIPVILDVKEVKFFDDFWHFWCPTFEPTKWFRFDRNLASA